MVDALIAAAFAFSAFIVWITLPSAGRDRLVYASRAMSWMTLAVAAVLPMIVLYTFLSPNDAAPLNLRLYHLGAGRLSQAVPLDDRMLAFACASIPLAIAVWGLLTLRQLFENFARQQIFEAATSRTLRSLALALFAFVVVAFATEAPISYFLTRTNSHIATLSIGFDDLVGLFAAAVAAVIARVLAEATQIADENAKFV